MAAWWSARVITFLLCALLAVVEMSTMIEKPSVSESFNLVSNNNANLTNSATFNKGFNNNTIKLPGSEASNEINQITKLKSPMVLPNQELPQKAVRIPGVSITININSGLPRFAVDYV